MVVCTESLPSDPDSGTLAGQTLGEVSPTYTVISNKAGDVYLGGKHTTVRVYGDKGVTLTIATNRAVTWNYSATVTLGAEAGVIFTKASASRGVTVGRSVSTATTVSGSWTVPSTQEYGWLEAGAHAYAWNFERYHYVAPCTKVVEKRGRIVAAATKSVVWYKHS